MKAFAIATALAVGLCATAISKSRAADGDFVEFGSTDNGWVYSVKEGSVRVDKNLDGEAIVKGLFQLRSAEGDHQYLIHYVTLNDCAAGYGTVVLVRPSNRPMPAGRIDFASRGDSLGSVIADRLCEAAGEELAERGSSIPSAR